MKVKQFFTNSSLLKVGGCVVILAGWLMNQTSWSATNNLGWRVEQDQTDEGWMTLEEQAFDDRLGEFAERIPAENFDSIDPVDPLNPLLANDVLVHHYQLLRSQHPDNLLGNARLGRWCANNGLPEQARAHWLRALDFDSNHRQIRLALGHSQINGNWFTPEELAREREQMEQWIGHLQNWTPEISQIYTMLSSSNAKQRKLGWEQLQSIDDPSVVPAIEGVIMANNFRLAETALDVVSKFDTTQATHVILRQALNSPSASCREKASRLLSTRDWYDFVPLLISQLRTPTQGRWNVARGGSGAIMAQMRLSGQTAEQDLVRQFETIFVPRDLAETQQSQILGRAAANQQIKTLGRQIALENQQIVARNAFVHSVLRSATGENPGDRPESWWDWWHDFNEVYMPVREVDYRSSEEVYYLPSATPRTVSSSPMLLPTGSFVTPTQAPTSGRAPLRYECLVPGTLITTDQGLKPVESILTGDRVLTHNFNNGQQEFKTVLSQTLRPETPTLRLILEDESIECSGGHPFWIEDKGWVKAREISSGMLMVTTTGVTRVLATEPSQPQPLYNLIVDGNANYFVGNHRILSHDNTIQSGDKTLLRR